jgi:hypothetical protein
LPSNCLPTSYSIPGIEQSVHHQANDVMGEYIT